MNWTPFVPRADGNEAEASATLPITDGGEVVGEVIAVMRRRALRHGYEYRSDVRAYLGGTQFVGQRINSGHDLGYMRGTARVDAAVLSAEAILRYRAG